MINKKDFLIIKKNMEENEVIREKTIQKSREVIQLSKKLIYALHRKDNKKAQKLFKDINREISELEKIGNKCQKFISFGMYNTAIQEFVEAACYYEFIVNKKIPGFNELKVEYESYLLGLCDLTGELERKAVYSTIDGDYKKVAEIRELVNEIYEQFLQFDLRNSELRKKSDSIKWNLKRIDEILYDLKLKDKI
ncbi:hypothetical protein JXB41_04165 [Candidatus Woesearchaeota archaeon]|nr:hypothetical protein [Candidatus Woesearchaeota archaeon]